MKDAEALALVGFAALALYSATKRKAGVVKPVSEYGGGQFATLLEAEAAADAAKLAQPSLPWEVFGGVTVGAGGLKGYDVTPAPQLDASLGYKLEYIA